MPGTDYVFPDHFEGPLVTWSIADGSVFKDGRKVLPLTSVREVVFNDLDGRVRVREVRLRLDDGKVVSFGSYGGAMMGSSGDLGYEGFKAAFLSALVQVQPETPVNTDAALLPRFSFGLLLVVIGALVFVVGLSAGIALVLIGLAITSVGVYRAYRYRLWDADRLVVALKTIV